MKNLFVTLICFSITQISTAQIESGRKFVGGLLSVSGSHTTRPDFDQYSSNNFNVNLNPQYGKFIRQNLAIGGRLTLGYAHSDYNYPSTGSSTSISSNDNTFSYGGAFFTKFYKSLTPDFYLTLEANIGASHSISYSHTVYNYSSGTTSIIDSETGGLTSSLYIIPGLTYFVNPNLAFELNFGNLHYTNNISFNDLFGDAGEISHSYGLSLKSSSLSLGVNYFF